jgi:hypothetical protein
MSEPVWAELIKELAALASDALKYAKTPAEVRRRIADGIQREDVVSTKALEAALRSADAVDDFIKNG